MPFGGHEHSCGPISITLDKGTGPQISESKPPVKICIVSCCQIVRDSGMIIFDSLYVQELGNALSNNADDDFSLT